MRSIIIIYEVFILSLEFQILVKEVVENKIQVWKNKKIRQNGKNTPTLNVRIVFLV